MHPRLCLVVNGLEGHRPAGGSKLFALSIPKGASPLTDPILLNLLSTYLSYALILFARPESSTQISIKELSTTLELPSTFSLLSWLPECSLLPSQHLDSLLTRAYTALTKLCNTSGTSVKSSSRSNSANPSISMSFHEALFNLRMYALRCLGHTSTGVVEGNTFWDQATKFATIIVKAIPAASLSTVEDTTTRLILRAFDMLVQIAETRPDKGVFMAVDENGKRFIAFCDYWSSFAQRVDIYFLGKVDFAANLE